MTDGYYHALSAGTTLLALDAYASATEGAARNLAIAEMLKNKSVRALTLPEELFPTVKFTDRAAALEFTNNTSLNAYYLIEQSGFDRKPPTQAIKQGLEVLREYPDGSGERVTTWFAQWTIEVAPTAASWQWRSLASPFHAKERLTPQAKRLLWSALAAAAAPASTRSQVTASACIINPT